MKIKYKALVEIEFIVEEAQKGLELVERRYGTTTKEETLSCTTEKFNEELRGNILEIFLPADATVKVNGEITVVE